MRLTTQYHLLKDKLEYLEPRDLEAIRSNAHALSLEDLWDFLSITEKDVPEFDRMYAIAAHKRGRAEAITKAGQMLQLSMQGKSGMQASLAYLQQMSGSFSAELVPTASKGFSFNINMDDKADKKEKA